METCNFHDDDDDDEDDDDDDDDDEPSISFFEWIIFRVLFDHVFILIWLGFSRWIEYLLICCLTQI